MVTKLQVGTKSDGDMMLGCVNEEINAIDFEVWDETLVIRQTRGRGLDFKRGDIRVEIEKKEAVKLAKSILFAFKK
jgi:hypothetical protein